jgi:hypothetical protein
VLPSNEDCPIATLNCPLSPPPVASMFGNVVPNATLPSTFPKPVVIVTLLIDPETFNDPVNVTFCINVFTYDAV